MDRQDSQRKQIQAWLKKGNPITPIMALQMFGCFRLASVIFRLRYEYGMDIITDVEHAPKGKRYATYFLNGAFKEK